MLSDKREELLRQLAKIEVLIARTSTDTPSKLMLLDVVSQNQIQLVEDLNQYVLEYLEL